MKNSRGFLFENYDRLLYKKIYKTTITIMAELKTKETKASVTAFLNAVTPEEKKNDSFVLLKMYEKVTGEKAVMWGELGVGPKRKGAEPTGSSRGRTKLQQQFMGGRAMIGFGKYHYKSERSAQEGHWPLVAFSPRKQNLTLYIMAGNKDKPDLLTKLGKYKSSVGCLYINKLSDVDIKVLPILIKNCLQFMKKQYKVK
jgi:hypothetical protein